MEFPAGKRLRAGSWSSVSAFSLAASQAASHAGGTGLSQNNAAEATEADPDNVFYSSCSYLRAFNTAISASGGWDGSLSSSPFTFGESGEEPKMAMAFFQLANKFFSSPLTTVELSIPISTCTCLDPSGTTHWYFRLPAPPKCLYNSHVLNYCTESFSNTIVSPPPDPPPPPPPVPAPPSTCTNTCAYAGNGICEDSHAMTSARCAFGTDCDDCGGRIYPPPALPPAPAPPVASSVLYVPNAVGRFVAGTNLLEVRSRCGMRAEGVVSIGLDSYQPAEAVAITDIEKTITFPAVAPGTMVRARWYATNALGRASS